MGLGAGRDLRSPGSCQSGGSKTPPHERTAWHNEVAPDRRYLAGMGVGPLGQPEKRFLSTAQKQDLAIRDNLKCRRLIQSEWYQDCWPIALTTDQNAKTSS